jgi:hypothetical protein
VPVLCAGVRGDPAGLSIAVLLAKFIGFNCLSRFFAGFAGVLRGFFAIRSGAVGDKGGQMLFFANFFAISSKYKLQFYERRRRAFKPQKILPQIEVTPVIRVLVFRSIVRQ